MRTRIVRIIPTIMYHKKLIRYVIPEAISGAAIAGGATVLAAGGTAFASGLMNKKTRKWNEKMVREQRAYNEQIYNQYESPAAQARQLAAAGYNPYATEASTQAVGKSSSIPAWNPTPMDFSGVAQAGQQIAASYHARKAQERQLEFQQKQLDQTALDQFRNYMLKAAEGVRDAKELDAKLELIRSQIDSYDASTKAQKTMNDMLDEFKRNDGNIYQDAHDLNEATIQKITQETQDNKELAALNRMIMSERHKLEMPVLQGLADKANISSQLYDLTGQDYSSLPPYLQSSGAVLVSIAAKLNDDMSLGQWREWRTQFESALQIYRNACEDWITNSQNKDNPNYQSDAQKTELFYKLIDTMLKIPTIGFGD